MKLFTRDIMKPVIYAYHPQKRKNKRKSVKKILLLFFLCFLITLLLLSILQILARVNETRENTVLSTIVSPLESVIDEVRRSSKLPEIVEEVLEGEDGKYAVYIENLKTGEVYEKNSSEQFASASLYKLWVMGETYRQIINGRVLKNRVMSDDVAKINERFNIATEAAELKEGEISMTVDEALYDMIANSDNYSALLLSQTIRLSNVTDFMEEYGYEDSHLDPPTTTASDIARFYRQLYNKDIINDAVSTEMMALLKDQTWNDRIPKYLPEDIVIAHKTGELDGVKHDAGIVFTDQGDYIIVLLSDTDSQQNAAEVEARISEAVYEYFKNQ